MQRTGLAGMPWVTGHKIHMPVALCRMQDDAEGDDADDVFDAAVSAEYGKFREAQATKLEQLQSSGAWMPRAQSPSPQAVFQAQLRAEAEDDMEEVFEQEEGVTAGACACGSGASCFNRPNRAWPQCCRLQRCRHPTSQAACRLACTAHCGVSLCRACALLRRRRVPRGVLPSCAPPPACHHLR